jgi:hypothetical protein
MRSLRTLIAAMLAFLLHAHVSAAATELVMFESTGCPWCVKWHAEVGPGYAKSDAGQRAPLRIHRTENARDVGVVLAQPVTFSPTFVLVDQGREVARITGYPGADFFWGLLEQMLAKLDKTATPLEQRADARRFSPPQPQGSLP